MARRIVDDLMLHYISTSSIGKGRFFKLYNNPADYAAELAVTTDELSDAMVELFRHGIGYRIDPSKQPDGMWKFALYKKYAALASTTTAVEDADHQTSHPPEILSHQSRTPSVTTPLSHPCHTPQAPRRQPRRTCQTCRCIPPGGYTTSSFAS